MCTMGLLHHQGSTQELAGEEAGAAAAGEFPTVPPRIFSFLRKSSCSILPLHTRKGLSSHTAHLFIWTGDCLGKGQTRPNSQLSALGAHSLHGFTTSSLVPFLQPQATSSLLVLLKPCLAGEGAINSALSQDSCGRPSRRLVPGTFLS